MNEKAAATWDSGARGYERISERLADAIDRCLLRLNLQPGERVLDVGTGTGWAARRAAATGARVTGIDLGPKLIEAARQLAARERVDVEFRVGDAEQLPFEDGSFDAGISTFGVMFVSRPEAAASELARVCLKGGRVALAAWLPDSTVARKFEMTKPYAPPGSGPSPFEWGRAKRVVELLGAAFELRFEAAVTMLRVRSGEEAWELFVEGYGPTAALVASLDAARAAAYRRDFIAFYEGFRGDQGIVVPREYLLAVGIRR